MPLQDHKSHEKGREDRDIGKDRKGKYGKGKSVLTTINEMLS